MHVKDVEMCCICGSYVCYMCDPGAGLDATCDGIIENAKTRGESCADQDLAHIQQLVAAAFSEVHGGCTSGFRCISKYDLPTHQMTLTFFKSNFKTLTVVLECTGGVEPLEPFTIMTNKLDMVRQPLPAGLMVASRSYDMRSESDVVYDIFQRWPQLMQ